MLHVVGIVFLPIVPVRRAHVLVQGAVFPRVEGRYGPPPLAHAVGEEMPESGCLVSIEGLCDVRMVGHVVVVVVDERIIEI